MMLKTTRFFEDYVAALEIKTCRLKKGTTLYRGSRFSVDHYKKELQENRHFSKSVKTAEEYARKHNCIGTPYIIEACLSRDMILLDIQHPFLLVRVAAGDAIYDVEKDTSIPEEYISLYRELSPNGGPSLPSMLSNMSSQEWQRLHLVDALKSVIWKAAGPDPCLRGYICEPADEVLLNPAAVAESELSIRRLSE